MEDLNKEIKIIKIIFKAISILIIIVGLGFSYLIAEFEDAPGVVIIGTTATLICTTFVYGFGEIIVQLKKNNILLMDIHKEIDKKR